ncbi:hypothetical protein N7540_000464 [Penicillium herquei]|nr:hypothetical protein N7540_000464 [Penicillium herquei]
MSGFEIAGLVLAIFPLVISGLENYGSSVESMKEWIRYETVFKRFQSALQRQKLFFYQNIEKLLSLTVQSDYEIAKMMNNPHDPLWKDPRLETSLRRRLPGEIEYICYMESVETFHEALKKLETKIQPLQEKSVFPSFVHKEYKRFTLTLSKGRREKLLNTLKQCNEDMGKLLGNSDELQPLRHKRKTRLPRVFQQICEQAASLHAALNIALQCKCSKSHSAELLLSPYPEQDSEQTASDGSSETLKLNLFFPMTADQWSNSLKLDHCPHYIRYAISAEMLVDHGAKFGRSEGSVKSTSPSKASEQGSTSQGTRKHSIATTRTVSFSSTLFSSGSTQSTRKTSNASSLQTDFVEILDICSSLRDLRTDQTSIGVLSDKDGRYHILRSVVHEALPVSDSPQLVTLDSLFKNSKETTPAPSTPLSTSQFSRHQRLSIALILARALLQLSPGPWLSHHWSKKDICFLRRFNGTIEMNFPLLVREFTKAQQPPVAKSQNAITTKIIYDESRAAIFSLGVLILELWFGQTIESLPFHGRYLGPDGAENEFTLFNTAQRWQEQTLEDGGMDLHNITRQCIFCAFGALSQDLRDDGLRRAIYDEVVKGLEKIVSQYEDF